MGRPRPNTIVGQFIPHRLEMLESEAWGDLSLAARRVLDRLEVEHSHHGGVENGNLPCTYDDFEKFGIRRKSISSAIAELVDHGFLEVTHQGGGGRYVSTPTASRYRLTYLATKRSAPTDEWKNKSPVAKTPLVPVAKTPLVPAKASGESAPAAPVAKAPLLSISREEPAPVKPLGAARHQERQSKPSGARTEPPTPTLTSYRIGEQPPAGMVPVGPSNVVSHRIAADEPQARSIGQLSAKEILAIMKQAGAA